MSLSYLVDSDLLLDIFRLHLPHQLHHDLLEGLLPGQVKEQLAGALPGSKTSLTCLAGGSR